MFSFHLSSQIIILCLAFSTLNVIINCITVRHFDDYPLAGELPFVSILVPARNEEQNIEACITSLVGQDYPNFEVIVLNDNSTDDTALILAGLAHNHPQLRVLRGTPLPDGWLGKNWACRQMDQVAKGELLLFTDADTRHSPDMLKTSVSALLAEQADLVTAFPREEMVTWGERLLVPIIGWGMFLLLPVRLVQKFHISWLSITIGQFMLFRREAYEAIGGYEAIKGEVGDDMCLGRRINASRHEWRLLNGTRQVSCRMYQGFWQAVNGFGKSLFGIFDYRILPYLLIWWFMGVAFLDPVVALVSRWLGYPLTTLSPIYATSYVALTLVLLTVAYRRFQFQALLVFLYPLSLALFIVVALRSMFQSFSGTSTWKDRVLERAAIRWL